MNTMYDSRGFMVNNLPTSRAELEDKGIVIETSNSNFVEIRHCSSYFDQVATMAVLCCRMF